MFNTANHPDLLIGLGVADDAAVYRINAKLAVVATLDFFAPVVDDPYTYGAIAAANAVSDVYAMGAEVVLALNIAAFPRDLPVEVIREILRGGADKVAEAGGVVAGGHTIWADKAKYGLSVLGIADPRRLFTKNALRPGDVLFLTKPIGTGTVVAATNAGASTPGWTAAATEWMTRLNRHASHLAHATGLRAATDVTGFGLMGHLWEMASSSGVAVELNASAVPLLPGARELSEAGFHTGGEARNRDWVEPFTDIARGVPPAVASLLFDPQTSGGLLLSAGARRATMLESRFVRDGQPVWRIGRVRSGPPSITVS